MSKHITIAEEFEIADEEGRVLVRQLLTPRGQLVEIHSERESAETDQQIRIDALALESLSWQEPETLRRQLLDDSEDERRHEYGDSGTTVDSFEVSNEYADARLEKLQTTAGERLLINAPVKGFELVMTSQDLRALATQETVLFSEFLETPHGPHGH
jgi:hypothetical protein